MIRRADPADAIAIASVLLRAFEDYRPQYTEGGFAATTPDAAEVARRMDEGPCWIAIDETCVGTVAAVPRNGELYVRSMAVLPKTRGRGIARALLDEVERYASAERFAELVLSTTPFLHAAIQLYERAGFVRTDEGPHELHGTPLFTMRKSLPRRDTQRNP